MNNVSSNQVNQNNQMGGVVEGCGSAFQRINQMSCDAGRFNSAFWGYVVQYLMRLLLSRTLLLLSVGCLGASS